MTDPGKYHSFSAADIERYHNGNMTALEMHALEKAALDDPFLADALEGYTYTTTPATDIQNIKSKLEEKLQTKKTIPLWNKKYYWLQIAALLFIIAGAGWLVIASDIFHKKEIAITTAPQKEQKNLPDNQPSGSIEKSIHSPNINVPEKKDNVAIAPVTVHLQKREKAKETTIRPVYNKKDFSLNTSTNERSLARLADTNHINKPDTNTAIATAQTIKPETKAPNDTSKTIHVVMHANKKNQDDIVVVGFGAKKRATLQPPATFEELEPAKGWNNYNDYIADNLQEPEEIKEKKLDGNVELSFDINKEGEAVNIKVEKSLCSKCDEEAIRLLKEGPKWKKKKTKKGKIAIHF